MGRHFTDYMSLCALEGKKIFFTTGTARQLAQKDSVQPTCLKIRGCKSQSLQNPGDQGRTEEVPTQLVTHWTPSLQLTSQSITMGSFVIIMVAFFFLFLIAPARSLQTEEGA